MEEVPNNTPLCQYSVHAEKNYPRLRVMEDAHCICDPLIITDEHSFALYAIFDGHGGKSAAEHSAKIIKDEMLTILDELEDETFDEMMEKLFSNIDDSIKAAGFEYPGCCAVVCLIHKYEGKTYVRMANCGDACGYVITEDEPIAMSVEHKATNPDEIKRIEAAGGMVMRGRVGGTIAIARALGDHYMKQWIISTPYCQELECGEKEKYVVMACDGLWDTVDAKTVKDVLLNADLDFQNSAKTLVQLAISKGSSDNVSVIVIKL